MKRRFLFFAMCILWAAAQSLYSLPFFQQEDNHKEKEKSLKEEETFDYYKKWRNQDVVYIITEEEYQVFTSLSTDDERDAFIEQFWGRRDPDPSTLDNEYKIEYYRRILYANENFTAGIPGWKTDRGRIYIMFGPPDRIESMPAGGHYHRKRKEGGGHTSVFPFEIWEYRHILGVGDDIELEFVDDGGGGLYELTFDPQRKDELLYSGFMGPTWDEIDDYEQTGSRLKQYRIARRRFAGDQAGPYRYAGLFETEKDRPFSKLILSSRLNSPPAIKYKDLEQIVKTAIYYNLVPFQVETATFQVSGTQSLVTVTLNIPHDSLTFKDHAGIMTTRAEVFGQVSNLSRRVETVFEEVVGREIAKGNFSIQGHSSSVFQKQLLLRPGLYKLNVVVKDVETGNLGTLEQRLQVPPLEDAKLALSSIMLAQNISTAEEADRGRFQVGRLKVVPRVSRVFRQDEQMGFYFQIYQSALDQTAGKPQLKVEFAITPKGSEPARWRDCSRLAFFAGNHSTVARLTSLEPFPPGDYMLRVRVRDEISGQTVQASMLFSIEKSKP